jgi:ABC-type Fe3+-hydroxamate transport system substrate-binding protein
MALSGASLLWVAAILVPGCDAEHPSPAAPSRPPERATVGPETVVTLSPVATRFVIALGAQELLVGVDSQSRGLPEVHALPTVDLDGARQLAPDLVLVPELPVGDAGGKPTNRIGDTEYVKFAPHDLEEVFHLSRTLGKRLVGRVRATRFELEIGRPLARIGGSSFGEKRPRVAPVVGLNPTQLAGGHSFATDLIEIAGGTSVTHGGEEESPIAVEDDDWRRLAPDLVLVLSREEMGVEERRAARAALPADYPVQFFDFESEFFWLEEPAETASRLRTLLRSHSEGSGVSAPRTDR